MEADEGLQVGQRIGCPHCGEKFSYGTNATRIQLPSETISGRMTMMPPGRKPSVHETLSGRVTMVSPERKPDVHETLSGRETLRSQPVRAPGNEAAKMGLSDAQLELGRKYEDKQKFDKAKEWYQKAANQGSKIAVENLTRLSVAQRNKELEEVARKEREAEREREQEEERLRTLRENVARLRESTGGQSAHAVVPPAGELQVFEPERTSRNFTEEDANSLSRLKFPPALESFVRPCYEKARDFALKGSSNMPIVRTEYKNGRERGGPRWPELERWLNWWK